MKHLFLLLLFFIPAVVMLLRGEFLIGGLYLGAVSLLIFIEKNEKAREIIEHIF